MTLGSVLALGVGIGWFGAAQWGPLPAPAEQSQLATVADVELAPAAQPEVLPSARPQRHDIAMEPEQLPAAQPEVLSSARLPERMQRDGMYLVGTDVTPGRYVATGTGSACYYATVSDLSGALDAVITTHFGDAWGRRVELDEGEYFETDACGSWLLESPR